MSFQRTCLIIGAGASVPYGFPTGAELRDLIVLDRSPLSHKIACRFPVRTINNSYFDARESVHEQTESKQQSKALSAWKTYLSARLQEQGFSAGDEHRFRQHFFNGRSPSIDRFIQFHPDQWGKMGQAYLAAVILNCEREDMLDKDWYVELLEQIAPNPAAVPPAGELSIINFNYDRSFAMFFLTSFRHQFNLSQTEADALFDRIVIEHVYGSLGSLDKVPYGNHSCVANAASGIDFMRDGAAHAKKPHLNNLISQARVVCFLGFSFAEENLALFDDSSFEGKARILATSLGLSQRRMAQVKRKIPSIVFHDMPCADLLRQEDIFSGDEPAIQPVQNRRAQIPVIIPRRRGSRDLGGLL